jgi:molecular chaperone HscB
METREALHEAATPDAVDALAVQAKRQAQLALAELADLFLHDDKPAIRKTLLRLRYFDKFAEEARARRMNLERSRV